MSDSRRIEGERVFCHSCHNEWDRASGGLTCPQCSSEFVEILSTPSSPQPSPPSGFHDAGRPPLSPPIHPLHDHNPWQGTQNAPDPEEDDITTFQFNRNFGRSGTISFTSRTMRMGGGRRNNVNDPSMAQVESNFETMLTNIMGVQPGANRGFPATINSMGTGFGMFGFPGAGPQGAPNTFTAAGRIYPGEQGGQPGSVTDLFAMLMGALGNGGGPQGDNRGNADAPPHPFSLLSQLFNPANAAHGDAVFSQEAFDRVISQLMEQNAGSTAPGPAPEEAIRALPTQKVEKSMLGSDDKAECSICMDNVEAGDEVTVLPCTHWFHGQCVSAWLKEHNTCPHCRKGIIDHSADAQQRRGSNRSSQRSSSVSSPRSPDLATRVRESPQDISAARQSYYGSSSGRTDYERRHSRSDSWTERRQPDGDRTSPRGGSSGNSNGSGGVAGWLNRHNPFS